MSDEWTPPPGSRRIREVTCCCYGIPEAQSDCCEQKWWIYEDDHPRTFMGEPICVPCWEEAKEAIARAKAKGVTVTVEFLDRDALS